MPFVLFLLGAAAVGLAVAAQKKGGGAIHEGGRGRTYTLDADLPPDLRRRVQYALAHERSGPTLLVLASEYAHQGYPLTATALTQRAIELGATPQFPPPPSAYPAPPPLGQPTSPPPPPPPPAEQASPFKLPFPVPPGLSVPPELALELSQLNPSDLAQLPEPPRARVLAAIASEKSKTALETLAQEMDAHGFPVAAKWLRAKIALLRLLPPPPPPHLPDPPIPDWAVPQGTPAAWPIPQAQPPAPEPPVHSAPPAPPIHLPPAPPPAPPTTTAPSPPPVHLPPPPPPAPPTVSTPSIALDKGMPLETQSAVLGALMTEQEPDKLEAFAHELQAKYPLAAGLLMAKANVLRPHLPGLPALPIPAPTTNSPTPPAPHPPTPPHGGEDPAPAHSAYPVGDESTRSGRNAGRPVGYPFIHLHGESTYPAKIAQEATGNAGNYLELSHINPHFVKDGTHWTNIQTGDAINVPWAWAPKLAGRYHLELDPGVTAPTGGASVVSTVAQGPAQAGSPATSTALAVANGGHNGLATHS